jgi:hypothetical protein
MSIKFRVIVSAMAALIILCGYLFLSPSDGDKRRTDEPIRPERQASRLSVRDAREAQLSFIPERIVGDHTLDNIRSVRKSAARPIYRLFDEDGLLTSQAISKLNGIMHFTNPSYPGKSRPIEAA